VSQRGLVVEFRDTRPSAAERPSDIACSEMPVPVSRMTVLRPKVSMCRCEGSPFPHELSFTRVRLRDELSMSCDSIRSTAAKRARPKRDGDEVANEFESPPEERMDALAVMGLA
jgi:hypothetical protein